MRNTIAISILGALALGLLVAGCGGGDSSSAEAQQLDKATYVKKAETICKQSSGRIAAGVTSGQFESPVRIVQVILIPGLEAELEELRALGIPKEAKREVQAFLKAAQDVIDAAKANPGVFVEAASPYEATELAGRRFGLVACPITPVEAG